MVKARAFGIVLATTLMVAGSFEPFFIRIFFVDRVRMGDHLRELPYRRAPGLRAFLVEAETRIPIGSSVVFLTPFTEYEGGYRYMFGRANYILAGRKVLPTVPRPGYEPESVAPDYLVGWDVEAPAGLTVEFRSAGGFVARLR